MMTLCIPTKDRSDFLARLLHYYASTRFPHWIFIGDSSDPVHARSNQRTVASLRGQLNIEHRLCPGCSSNTALEQLSASISTPYCAFVADDDFLCTQGIGRCLAFLTDHHEYSAAHGTGLLLQTEGDGPYGAVGTVKYYPQAVLSADTGSERLKEFFTSSLYALLFSVHRTETWKAMFRGLTAMQGTTNRNEFKDELISTCVSVVRGKVKELDGLYLIRQTHRRMYRQPHVYDWLTDPAWFPSYQFFHDRLVEELIRQDGLSVEQARAAIREGFWTYLASYVMSTWRKERTRAARKPSRLRIAAKRLPGAQRTWRAVRSILLRWRDELSLPALLDPSSPYHADFMPIYQIITSGPKEPLSEGFAEDQPVAIATGGVGTHG